MQLPLLKHNLYGNLSMTYTVAASGRTDVGQVRQNNEDSFGTLPELRFYIVADGMGGHNAGEVASNLTVEELSKLAREHLTANANVSTREITALLLQMIQKVNEKVFQLSIQNEKLRGMGTTLCCIYFLPKVVVCAHVGDSRIYRMHNGKLSLITSDHSLLQELLDLGQISEEDAGEFVYRNIITKAIGTEPYVEASINLIDVVVGDLFMMCSDGLSDLLTLSEMEQIIKEASSLDNAASQLIANANKKGGVDNITTLIMKIQ